MENKSLWTRKIESDPEHSAWYIDRFERMRRAGRDLDGEARTVDAMAPRGAAILDAGSGPGRVGSELQRSGHHVVGVDVDPALVTEAQRVCPEATWLTADLCEVGLMDRLRTAGAPVAYDVIVCAGNVMTFLAPGTHRIALGNLWTVLGEGGRIIVGFGTRRGYTVDRFGVDVEMAGLRITSAFSTWDLRPWHGDDDFLVAILEEGAAPEDEPDGEVLDE